MAVADAAKGVTDAGKAVASKGVGVLSTVAGQVFHPRNWLRNAAIGLVIVGGAHVAGLMGGGATFGAAVTETGKSALATAWASTKTLGTLGYNAVHSAPVLAGA